MGVGNDSADVPLFGRLGEGGFPVQVLVLTRPHGGWHVACVYYRVDDGDISIHPMWAQTWSDDPEDDWTYLSDRVLTGNGGNWYSYEIEGYAVGVVADIEPLVTAREARIVAATFGPLGEVAATISAPSADPAHLVSMPFVVLPDDHGDIALVATGTVPSIVDVQGELLFDPQERPFKSVEHWQRADARSWPLICNDLYQVRWNDSLIYLRVSADGTITYLSHEMPVPNPAPALVTETPNEDCDAPNASFARSFIVARASYPGDIDRAEFEDEYRVLGGQYEWNFATPWLYRVLASPRSGEKLPEVPRRGSPHELSFGYWTCLLHMLIYSLGWVRPDLGLEWWYDNGKPIDDDPRLRLLSEIWDADGQLDWFGAWLWTSPYRGYGAVHTMTELCGYEPNPRVNHVDARWTAAELRSAAESGICYPGLGDALHLTGHTIGPVETGQSERGTLLRTGRYERRATLLLDSMIGWYANLAQQGNDLPDIGHRSWQVDVVVKPVGWLGTYRRSRATGLWFSGQHRYHLPGT